jgi:hypothetical protein
METVTSTCCQRSMWRSPTQTRGPKLAPAFRDPAVGGLRSSISEEFRKTMLDSHWPRSSKADDASCHYTAVTVPGMTLHVRLDESRCPHLLIGHMWSSGCFSKTQRLQPVIGRLAENHQRIGNVERIVEVICTADVALLRLQDAQA